jgi:hypothetical protein
MPRVVPSQVVGIIDQNFPNARTAPDFAVYSRSAGVLTAIIRLTEEIPTELLVLNAEDYNDLVCGLENLSSAVTEWHQRGGDEPPARIKGKSPIAIIRETLSKCPDESPAPGTVELSFIGDAALRESIRVDISAANRDAANGEWKGATVLAGSAAEALLLWAIQDAEQRASGSIAKAVAALRAAGTFKPQQPKSSKPEEWIFIELIEAAQQIYGGDPTKRARWKDTANQARLCKDFRNLIHPGRSIRLNQVCDRGTALSALAAAELIVRALKPQS